MKTISLKVLSFFAILLIFFCVPTFSADFRIPNNTNVKFKYFIAGIPFGGEFKVTDSSFDIDFEKPSKSIFSVNFDLMQSNAGFPLATVAMKKVLDASRFPNVVFVSELVEFKENFFT